jgi:hypothetical protein
MEETQKITIEQAAPGMELAGNIYDNHDRLILAVGAILTKNVIANLISLNIANLSVKIDPIDDDILQDNNVKEMLTPQSDFDIQVDKILSMVLHYDEVKGIAEVIKRIHREQTVCGRS